MADAVLAARQRQTEAGRRALAAKFPTPEAKTEFYRALARKSAEGRLILSSDEAMALGQAYQVLARIVGRIRTADRPLDVA